MATATATATASGTHATDATSLGSAGQGDLQCVVVTPEKTLFDQRVDFVAIPLFDGELGVLPGRAPLIGRLGFGELRTRSAELTRRYFIDGGFAQVRDDVVTILTNRAVPLFELQAAEAHKELELAAKLKTATDFEIAEKAKAQDRARAKLRLATKRSG
jgi:F-type H+-transporting ATPase subunit epsilon